MATLGIVVKSDFDQASRDLKDFKANAESTEKSIKKFQDSFKGQQVDKFLDKQKLARTALTATRGEVDANQAEYRALRNEIEKLIKRGIDPQDESLKRLTKRYDEVGKEINQYSDEQKKAAAATEKSAKMAELAKRAFKGLAVAAVAAAVATVKNVFAVAEVGDAYAKASSRIGLTAEQLQELTFAADRQGVSGEELTKGIEKLNKNVGDLRAGYGSLSTSLKKTNPELLKNLKNARDSEEAWNLSVEALNKTSNELDKAALAQALFGRAGTKLLTVTDAGTKGIQALRDEARSYGVISNESAKRAEEFVDAQTNLVAAFTGFRNELATKSFPVLKVFLENITTLFTREKDLNQVTNDLIKANTEYAKITKTLSEESKNLSDNEKTKLEIRKAELKLDVINNIERINKLYADQKKLLPELTKEQEERRKNIEAEKEEIERLTKRFDDAVAAGKRFELPGLKRAIQDSVGVLRGQLRGLSEVTLDITKRNSAYQEGVKSLAFALKNKLITTGDLVGVDKELIKQATELAKVIDIETGAITNNNDAVQAGFENKKAAMDALKTLEAEDYAARLEALNEFNEQVKNSIALSELEKQDIVKKSNAEIAKIEKMQREMRIKNITEFKNLIFSIGSEIVGIIRNTTKDQRKAAIAEKAIGIARAGVNTALGVTTALSSGKIAKAILIGILGAAQITKIATTPIPTAQTGTGPDGLLVRNNTRTGQDNIAVRATDGETVDVRPRGEAADRSLTVNAMLNESVLFTAVQKGIDNGDINITNDNVQLATV